MTPTAREFLTELAERHGVFDAVFPVDDAAGLKGTLRRENHSYRIEIHSFRNSVERVLQEI